MQSRIRHSFCLLVIYLSGGAKIKYRAMWWRHRTVKTWRRKHRQRRGGGIDGVAKNNGVCGSAGGGVSGGGNALAKKRETSAIKTALA